MGISATTASQKARTRATLTPALMVQSGIQWKSPIIENHHSVILVSMTWRYQRNPVARLFLMSSSLTAPLGNVGRPALPSYPDRWGARPGLTINTKTLIQ